MIGALMTMVVMTRTSAPRGKYFRDNDRRMGGEASAVDDLQFYLSYHATMTLAGKLLDEHPLHEDLQEPGDDWRTFRRWLRSQGLTRSDGLWLADRRDTSPAECVSLPATKDEDWPSSLDDERVDGFSLLPNGRVVDVREMDGLCQPKAAGNIRQKCARF